MQCFARDASAVAAVRAGAASWFSFNRHGGPCKQQLKVFGLQVVTKGLSGIHPIGSRLKAGQAMLVKFACLFVKGDWAEFAHTLGLPTWNDGLRPCFACPGYGPDLFASAGNNAQTLRWDANSDADFEAACRRCEIRLRIVRRDTRDRIYALLRFDRRPGRAAGLAMSSDLLELGLRTGDRLEPSPALPVR